MCGPLQRIPWRAQMWGCPAGPDVRMLCRPRCEDALQAQMWGCPAWDIDKMWLWIADSWPFETQWEGDQDLAKYHCPPMKDVSLNNGVKDANFGDKEAKLTHLCVRKEINSTKPADGVKSVPSAWHSTGTTVDVLYSLLYFISSFILTERMLRKKSLGMISRGRKVKGLE